MMKQQEAKEQPITASPPKKSQKEIKAELEKKKRELVEQ